ncbi:RelA/SpoT family protein [Alkalitalea saponilacus]|uniref:GTP pyrophosphokinase n=1 Tax=Alkalitalea saponilacus TaxID=889453 RepID=A0A1T5CPW4_9BACT|nr:RelA/SpoT family protein [Alkalitalea saponilacus]ASB49935.1 RelA/SpoT family protein [Alkalitalea saponilacus]SKB61220.1 GTP pyrophosphokinase [Alkalitalea saponilacus]
MSEETLKLEEQEAKQELDEILKICNRCQKPEDYRLIQKAFELALEAHKGVRRKSGELYITHPLAVARIVAEEIGLGPKGISAAILHDVVEDTDYTVDDIKTIFGDTVANIVDGLTKLEGAFDQTQSKQAENFRKLLLTMVEDVRVILIKLADRLHNMRTLDSMPEHKKLKIAGETLFIYAPLAHRLGLYAIKTELEDLSLKYEHPGIYQEISDDLKEYQERNLQLLNRFSLPIIDRLKKEGYEFDIVGRPKSIFSIWTKMQKKQIPFEEIYDLLALRIVFQPKPAIPEKSQCWNIYSYITDLYKPKPDRLRDWVSVPKANGYEALHATFMGPDGKWVEIQIRSARMDEIAERGFAAHWKYKGQSDKESELDNWLKRIREVLENPDSDSLEFLDDFKLNLFSAEMMIFTPKGDVKILPKGATTLDLAFEIHSNIGYKCIGAKVNYKLVPLSHELKSGDQVEILTSEKQTPKYEWLSYVTTAKAKTRIKDAFKKERKDMVKRGESVLEDALKKKKLTINAKILKKLQNFYNLPNKEELYIKISRNLIRLDNLQKILSDKTTNKWVRYWRLSFGKTQSGVRSGRRSTEKASKPNEMVVSDQMDDESYLIAPCCNPIPGDDVVGYHDDKEKLILHSRKCPVAIRLMSSHGNRIVSASWESHKILSFLAVINLSGIDQIGIVSKITKVISDDQNVNMRSIHFDSHDGIFEGTIYLYIHNTEDLNNLIFNISRIKGVHNVSRQERINA